MTWFFPSWNGDVRIEADPEDPLRTVVTVIEPTAFELEVLDAATNVFRAKGWMPDDGRLWLLKGDQERQNTVVQATLFEVGYILLGRLKPGVATLTAVTNLDGTVEAMGSAEPGFLTWINKKLHGDVGDHPALVNFRDQNGYAAMQAAKRKEAELLKIKAAEEEAQRRVEAEAKKRAEEVRERQRMEDASVAEDARKREEEKRRRKEEERKRKEEERDAVSVKRPTCCCPNSIPGVIEPAQEVLLRFCDAEQREQWLGERRLVARGAITGHRYLIAHRHTPTAIRNTKIAYDLDDGCVMHFHDWTVPPEEEVLAAKLILEHRESWLRNEATCFGSGLRFKNPFGGGGDGVADASFTREIGRRVRSRLRGS